jgi:hypothetical protein
MNTKYEVIGELNLDRDGNILSIKRGASEQGYIYKNYNAYLNDKSAVCYVAELSDCLYTGQDFLDMCNGQEEIADQVFEAVDWQSPETYLQEQYDEELYECDCGMLYWCYGFEKCPYCGIKKKTEY